MIQKGTDVMLRREERGYGIGKKGRKKVRPLLGIIIRYRTSPNIQNSNILT